MHTLFCITGRTGAGKDTLVNEIKKQFGLTSVLSYTTRPRRDNEGDTHIFITEPEVEQYRDDIVAFTEINHYQYFATKQQLNTADFYIIDPNGISYLKEKCPDLNLVVINIAVPEDFRKFRALTFRHDSEFMYQKRSKAESKQFDTYEKQHKYDYQVLNLDKEKAVNDLMEIVLKYKPEVGEKNAVKHS